MNNPPVANALKEIDIPHRVFVHPGPVKSLEQAAEERGQKPGQVIRSLLFRVADDNYLMVLVAGPLQISWSKLRKYVGVRRISMASSEDVLSVTGYEIGSVSPFGNPAPLRVLVDESVSRQTEVSIGSGVRGTTIFIAVKDLIRALGDVEITDLVS